ncbi:substrate-binding domain-containing protein [Prauserella alba]|uniref:Extracellular solute-binding protein n=1 Tax=Prauserella alba TaxID=176898 RepID=A0ABP4FPT8_9PSEU|nr:substrate-binding domain-containing protein [Prauserella alba]MCP2180143.1 extracellular solute-binding protein [Prauserella alba]
MGRHYRAEDPAPGQPDPLRKARQAIGGARTGGSPEDWFRDTTTPPASYRSTPGYAPAPNDVVSTSPAMHPVAPAPDADESAAELTTRIEPVPADGDGRGQDAAAAARPPRPRPRPERPRHHDAGHPVTSGAAATYGSAETSGSAVTSGSAETSGSAAAPPAAAAGRPGNAAASVPEAANASGAARSAGATPPPDAAPGATRSGTGSSGTAGDRDAVTSTGGRRRVTASGRHSAVSATGERSAVSATGERSAVSATGGRRAVTSTGRHGTVTSTGSHRAVDKKPKRRIAAWPVACGVLVVLIVVGIFGWNWADGVLSNRAEAQAAACQEGRSTLRVATAPAVAEPVQEAAKAWNDDDTVVHGHCITVKVQPGTPSEVFTDLTGDRTRGTPAAWITGDTAWSDRLASKQPDRIGASPEKLTSGPDGTFTYVSLAGNGVDTVQQRAAQSFRAHLTSPEQQKRFAKAGFTG